jgi:replicative DNA helicase
MSREYALVPHSVEAEQSVLGGLMLRPAALVEISGWIAEGDFYRRDHQLIYRGINELSAREVPCDAVTLGEWFESMEMSEQVAGGRYLIELASTTPSAANIKAYAEIVLEKSQWRQLIQSATDLANAAHQPGHQVVADVAQEHCRRLAALVSDSRSGPEPVKTCLQALYDDLLRRHEQDALPGIPTPWREINEITHGLQDGEVVVIAARSNMGKSVIGFQLSAFNALRGNRTVRFSLEMNKTQATRRDVAALGGIPHSWLIEPKGQDYWPQLTQAMREMRDAQLLTDDSPRLTAAQISARAQREHLRAPVRMVLVDHLHELKLPGKQGEVIERGDAMRDLKALAKRLGCPVVVLAQLNRAAAKNDGSENSRPPRLTDLRGSGGIEEVADVVLFLHRPDYYKPEDRPGVIEVTVGKGRDIPTGKTIYLQNRFDVMRAEDWDGPLPTACSPPRQSTRGFDPNA